MCLCINIRIRYKEFAHAILEADKSQDLQSANWKPRTANGIVPVQGRQEELMFQVKSKGRKH